jgi:ribosomal protein S18 acetylase RimI-like enzyme
MHSPEIKIITGEHDEMLNEVLLLFSSMYEEMRNIGLMLDLSPGGPEKWLKGIVPTLGKTSCLIVSQVNSKVVGFAHGSLRFTPEYLGGGLTGMVTHIYVSPGHRGKGIGDLLLGELEKWFKVKNVSSIDLQVIEGNEAARRFWQKNGYQVELFQYRKFF